MLTCEAVRAELPAVETGETATGALAYGEVRDHLAACEACRAEAARVRVELEKMRGELAALAPSPFLEDAVLDAVRESVAEPLTRARGAGPRRARGPGTWVRAAVALAAAALLVGVLILDRNGTTPESALGDAAGERDPGGPATVAMPSTADEVNAARKETVERSGALVDSAPGKRGAAPDEYIHIARTAEDNQQLTYAPRILAPKEGAPHRWVFRERDVLEKDRRFTMVGVPVADVATLGRELLTLIGNAGGEHAKDPVAAGLRRLSMGPGQSRFLTLEIADPSGRGAAAHVRVLVSDMYTGSLVLEEALGRALGLHRFEIPGSAMIAGDMSIGARRAWARIRIAGIEFDETVEVQVLESGATKQVKGGLAQAPRESQVIFTGERPDTVYASNDLDIDANGHVRIEMTGIRSWDFDPRSQLQATLLLDAPSERYLTLAHRDGKHPTSLVFLPTEDQRVLPGPRAVHLERVTLPGPYPVGAQAVIGRVWRGRAAIPSRESVALTTVAEDGSVSFVRTRGERGPLRMRLFASNVGTESRNVQWYTFDPDDERLEPLVLTIDGGGQVTIGRHTIALVAPAPTGNRLAADPPALAALVRELQDASRKAGWTGPGHTSPLALRVVSGRDEPWAAVHATFYAAAQAGIAKFHLAIRGEPDLGVPFRLPVDRGLLGPERGLQEEIEEEEVTEEPGSAPPIARPKPGRRKGEHPVFELRVRREKGVTRFTMPYQDGTSHLQVQVGDMSVGSPDLAALRKRIAKLAKARAPKRRLQVQINLREVDLEEIPYAEMRDLIVILRAGGVDDIQMLMPLPGGR